MTLAPSPEGAVSSLPFGEESPMDNLGPKWQSLGQGFQRTGLARTCFRQGGRTGCWRGISRDMAQLETRCNLVSEELCDMTTLRLVLA